MKPRWSTPLFLWVIICIVGAIGASGALLLRDSSSTASTLVPAARAEGRLVLYANFHSPAVTKDLTRAFQVRYPYIEVKDVDLDGATIFSRFLDEIKSGHPQADILLSSAMDLQEKLINDGYAEPYTSQEMRYLPAWAHWRDLAYGTTYEPIAFIYNRRFISDRDVPQTHAELIRALQDKNGPLFGRVAIYDPEKSDVGLLILSEDAHVTEDTWNLFEAFGKANAQPYKLSKDIVDQIASGNKWFGYDVIASYALDRQKAHPELGVVYPSDYTLVLSRVAFISAYATHPAAAKLFLDFVLSEDGQKVLARHGIRSVRTDAPKVLTDEQFDPDRAQGIRIGPSLLTDLDSLVRARFLGRWHASVSSDSLAANAE